MKKKLSLTLLSLLLLTSCNKQIYDFQYKFESAILTFDGWQTSDCYNLEKWKDYDDGEQLQLTLENGSVILTSIHYAILMSGSCPIN